MKLKLKQRLEEAFETIKQIISSTFVHVNYKQQKELSILYDNSQPDLNSISQDEHPINYRNK